MKFRVVDVSGSAAYRGETYTYTPVVETEAGEIIFKETTSIKPEDVGKSMEREVESRGKILQRIDEPKGIIDFEGDHQEFEGVLKEVSESRAVVEVDGMMLEMERLDSREDWSDFSPRESVRFACSFQI